MNATIFYHTKFRVENFIKNVDVSKSSEAWVRVLDGLLPIMLFYYFSVVNFFLLLKMESIVLS